jgi:hypothetical protein
MYTIMFLNLASIAVNCTTFLKEFDVTGSREVFIIYRHKLLYKFKEIQIGHQIYSEINATVITSHLFCNF